MSCDIDYDSDEERRRLLEGLCAHWRSALPTAKANFIRAQANPIAYMLQEIKPGAPVLSEPLRRQMEGQHGRVVFHGADFGGDHPVAAQVLVLPLNNDVDARPTDGIH